MASPPPHRCLRCARRRDMAVAPTYPCASTLRRPVDWWSLPSSVASHRSVHRGSAHRSRCAGQHPLGSAPTLRIEVPLHHNLVHPDGELLHRVPTRMVHVYLCEKSFPQRHFFLNLSNSGVRPAAIATSALTLSRRCCTRLHHQNYYGENTHIYKYIM